jgi:hypothetical protein
LPAGRRRITLRLLVREAENELFDPTGRHLSEAALEVGCETLLELELICASAGDDLRERLRRAVASLRLVLTQLRLAQAPDASALNYGFVIAKPTPDQP